MTIIRFNSPAELGRRMKEAGDPHGCGQRPETNNESFEDSCRLAISGDLSLVDRARSLLDSVATEIPIPERVAIADVCGGYPIVPEAIAGFPLAMRRRVPEPSASSPVNFYVGISPQGRVTANEIRDYGITLVALVWALSLSRPVSLHTIEFSGGYGSAITNGEVITVTRIETQPLDLATACYALTSAGFMRHLCFGMATVAGGNGRTYPVNYNPRPDSDYYRGLRRRLAMSGSDVFLPNIHSGDLALTDPVGWITQQLEPYSFPE